MKIYFVCGVLGWLLFSGCAQAASQPLPATATPTRAPTATAVCQQTTGQVVEFVYPTDNPGRTALVYLPPCYDTAVTQTYPTLYLIHGGGGGGSAENIFNLGVAELMDAQINAGALRPYIIVAPDVIEFLSADEWIAKELVPAIDATFRTQPDRLYRGVAGISMGGGEAGAAGFRQPELFGAMGLYAMVSPLRHYDGYMASRRARSDDLAALLGAVPANQTPHVYIDIGHRDQLRRTSEAILLHLQDAHIPVIFSMGQGGHAHSYFASRLDDYLHWFDAVWGRSAERVTSLPGPEWVSCAEEHGRVETATFAEEITIYLPPCYDKNPEKAYPVLYLLEDAHDWFALGAAETMDELTAEALISPYLLVTLPAAKLDETMPLIENKYRVLPDRSWRGIAGIGAEGDFALTLGLKAPEQFGSIGAYRVTENRLVADWAQWLANEENRPRPFILMDAGHNDSDTLPIQLALNELFNAHDIPHSFTIGVGGNNDHYLETQLQNYLFWHGRAFGRTLPDS